jgi:hypothetical protein
MLSEERPYSITSAQGCQWPVPAAQARATPQSWALPGYFATRAGCGKIECAPTYRLRAGYAAHGRWEHHFRQVVTVGDSG